MCAKIAGLAQLRRSSGDCTTISLRLLDFDTAVVAAALDVPGFEVPVLDRFVLHVDVPQVVGWLELFLAAGRFSFLRFSRGVRCRGCTVDFLSAIEGVFPALGPRENGGRAVDAVGLEDASQVGVAGEEEVVVGADHLDQDLWDVVAAGGEVADVDAHAALAGGLLDFQFEWRDQDESAGVEVIAAADDEVGALFFDRKFRLLRFVGEIFAVAKRDAERTLGIDAGEVDGSDVAEVLLAEIEFHQIDFVDLQGGLFNVAVVELDLDGLAGLESGDFAHADLFLLEVVDGVSGVGVELTDFFIPGHGLGGFTSGVVDLGGNVAGVVTVFAVAIGHAGGAGESLFVVALPEVAEGGHVFEAGLELAVGVALGAAGGVLHDVRVVFEGEVDVGLGEGSVVGERAL